MNNIIRLIHRGTGGQKGWIYSVDGVISTIPVTSYKDPPKIVIPNRKRTNNEQKQNYSNREYKERN